jgi:hypothetical protein
MKCLCREEEEEEEEVVNVSLVSELILMSQSTLLL